MTRIDEDAVEYMLAWSLDETGRVFRWNNLILRGIRHEAADRVRRLFKSGFLDELSQKGLFPKSQITDYSLADFAFVVEHEVVPYVTYAHEWSFDMLRDSALAVLEICEIAARHGWFLKDCHHQNVLFHGAQPMYVDLGSFMLQSEKGSRAFVPSEELLGSYWWPLKIWASGDGFLSQRIISSAYQAMPSSSWQLYHSLLVRLCGRQLGGALQTLVDRVLMAGARRLRLRGTLGCLPLFLTRFLPTNLIASDARLMKQRIQKLASPERSRIAECVRSASEQASQDRCRTQDALEIIRGLNVRTVVDLAGGNGQLSAGCESVDGIQQVVCVDSDPDMVNQVYLSHRGAGRLSQHTRLQCAVLNFMVPETNCLCSHPAERLRGDLVILLGRTRELILHDQLPLKEVLRALARFTHSYVLVDFMASDHPTRAGIRSMGASDDYSVTWFQAVFTEVFDLVSVGSLDQDHVLFLGRLRLSESEDGQME